MNTNIYIITTFCDALMYLRQENGEKEHVNVTTKHQRETELLLMKEHTHREQKGRTRVNI